MMGKAFSVGCSIAAMIPSAQAAAVRTFGSGCSMRSTSISPASSVQHFCLAIEDSVTQVPWRTRGSLWSRFAKSSGRNCSENTPSSAISPRSQVAAFTNSSSSELRKRRSTKKMASAASSSWDMANNALAAQVRTSSSSSKSRVSKAGTASVETTPCIAICIKAVEAHSLALG
ncbi:hypothetical protein DSECCO2_607140 [anaerobic digester metagenome]